MEVAPGVWASWRSSNWLRAAERDHQIIAKGWIAKITKRHPALGLHHQISTDTARNGRRGISAAPRFCARPVAHRRTRLPSGESPNGACTCRDAPDNCAIGRLRAASVNAAARFDHSSRNAGWCVRSLKYRMVQRWPRSPGPGHRAFPVCSQLARRQSHPLVSRPNVHRSLQVYAWWV